MAEIKIEKKESRNWLPLIFGLLGLLLLGWLAVDFFDKDGEPELLTADEVNFPDGDFTDRPDADALNAKKDNLEDLTEFDVNWDGANANYDDNVKYFLSSIDRDTEDLDMNVHHDYCHVALKALSNSLMALAKETEMVKATEVKDKVNLIKENAVEITEDWKDTDHADMIRAAMLASVNVLKDIQEEKFPNLKKEVMSLENSAKAVKKETLTLDQKKVVKTFFQEAATVMQKMRQIAA